jgi:hypothetical protein
MWFLVMSWASAAVPQVLLAPDGLAPSEAPPPRFPADSPPARCLVRAEITPEGVPGAVEARDCSLAASAVMTQAISTWRWPPPVDETGAPASAVLLIPIAFTPKGSVPTVVPERCTYRLEVASTGAVRMKGDPVSQCEMWAPVHLGIPIVPVGACELAVDANIVRETEGWLDTSACPPEAGPIAQALLARSLFAHGRTETRVILELPTQAAVPLRHLDVVSAPELPTESNRLAEESSPEDLDPRLEPEAEPVPAVDLSALTERNKKK